MRGACITTSASNGTACCRAGRSPRGRASIGGRSAGSRCVEDHPLEYASFEGTIPPRPVRRGHVDRSGIAARGRPDGDFARDYRRGRIKFTLAGERLHGRWALVRMQVRRGGARSRGRRCEGELAPMKEVRLRAGPRRAGRRGPHASGARAPAAKDRRAPPAWIGPQLATPAAAPSGSARAGATRSSTTAIAWSRGTTARCACFTRNRHDWTASFRDARRRASAISTCGNAWIDGEAVVFKRRRPHRPSATCRRRSSAARPPRCAMSCSTCCSRRRGPARAAARTSARPAARAARGEAAARDRAIPGAPTATCRRCSRRPAACGSKG